MGEGKSSQDSTFPADDEHLFGYSNSTYDILGLFGVIELFNIVDLVDVRLIVSKPANLPTHLAIPPLGRGFEHGQSGSLALVLPHIDVVLGACNNVGLGHPEYCHLQTYLLGLNSSPYRVAKVNLGYILLGVREDRAILPLSTDLNEFFHIFHVLLIRFSIPKDHAELHSIGFLVGKH